MFVVDLFRSRGVVRRALATDDRRYKIYRRISTKSTHALIDAEMKTRAVPTRIQ
jgi:hypothetical protein